MRFDDPAYVTGNDHVRAGLTASGVRWAFTSAPMLIWHPVTLLSHLLDGELHGLDPSGHHVTNVVLHILNTLLLYAALRSATGATVRSGGVAALFALHPLHVESVAWVSERKDLLSAFFGLLAVIAYLAWARRPSGPRYAAVTALLVLGLLAKPMLVTLPLVFLLLDHWPLGRFPGKAAPGRLVVEKLPWLGLSGAVSAVAFVVQQRGGAMVFEGAGSLSTWKLLANVPVAYVQYLRDAFWPTDLNFLVPHPSLPMMGGEPLASGQVAGAVLVLAGISAAVFWARRPYARVGWLWYLGMLVPVIGLVQVGVQARADRYTYLPLVGFFILVVWGAAEAVERLATRRPWVRAATATLAAFALGALGVAAHAQASTWRSSLALFERALAVNPRNATAHNNLGNALLALDRDDEAIGHYREAVKIHPKYDVALENLGNALHRNGNAEEAAAAWRRALEWRPASAPLRIKLAGVAVTSGDRDGARALLEEALVADPEHALAHVALGEIAVSRGERRVAEVHYREGLRLAPEVADVHLKLARLYEIEGRLPDAIAAYEAALRLRPGSALTHTRLAALLGASGDLDLAIVHLRRAVLLEPGMERAQDNLRSALAARGTAP